MTASLVPGVRIDQITRPPAPALRTGVPVFLGHAGAPGGPVELTSWPAFVAAFPPGHDSGHDSAHDGAHDGGRLAAVVHDFFAGGGRLCHVVGLDPDPRLSATEALARGLDRARDLTAADLVCVPDVARSSASAAATLQAQVLDDCRRTGGRFALLDTVPGADPDTVVHQCDALAEAIAAGDCDGTDGALYHPWTSAPGPDGTLRDTPPCGHVAAVLARSDAAVGVHKSPANEVLEGVVDLRADLSGATVGRLVGAGVNCLSARPGRGIRVWGARTLSADPGQRSLAARRVLLTTGRWIERFLDGTVFEPNDLRLQVRITRELSAYLEGLHARGALRGRTPEEAFFVRCDAGDTWPGAGEGEVVTTVGLALTAPVEFVVLRVVRGPSGVTTEPPAVPA